jgi:hypothetical protein
LSSGSGAIANLFPLKIVVDEGMRADVVSAHNFGMFFVSGVRYERVMPGLFERVPFEPVSPFRKVHEFIVYTPQLQIDVGSKRRSAC